MHTENHACFVTVLPHVVSRNCVGGDQDAKNGPESPRQLPGSPFAHREHPGRFPEGDAAVPGATCLFV